MSASPTLGSGAAPRAWVHAALVTSTIVILALTIAFWVYGFVGPPEWRIGYPDLTVYTDATRRLLSGGSWYLDHQLSGPYEITQGDVLYPPVTAWFFALWLVLPAPTFSAIPVVITAAIVWRFRPAPWTWPLIALCIAWPMVPLKILRLNPNVWLMAAVATGLVWRWPGAFVVLKPSMLPFALVGIRSKGWWITAALLAVASVPVLTATLQYPQVILNSRGGGLLYSLPDVPFLLLPLIAWAGSRTRRLAGGSLVPRNAAGSAAGEVA